VTDVGLCIQPMAEIGYGELLAWAGQEPPFSSPLPPE
jgi:hypothetical protein